MAALIAFLLLTLITSFLCSIMEAVLLSLPLSYLKSKSEDGNPSINRMIGYKEDVDKPLSAILSLNTVAHTVGAAGVGAQATKVFGEAYFGLTSAILTILILVLTEIIPKTLGANYNKSLLGFTSGIIRATIIITYPLVWISSMITRLISKKELEPTTSREEISALAGIGEKEGIFQDKETAIIQNIINLKSIPVKEIMTPRIVVETASEDLSLDDFYNEKEKFNFSRIPIYNNDKDNTTGYVMRQMVFEKLVNNENSLLLKDIKRDILKFPEDTSLFDAWETMIQKKEHISVILGPYGGMNGIVTFEDILESLLGFEIVDETDREVDMQEYALKKFKKQNKS